MNKLRLIAAVGAATVSGVIDAQNSPIDANSFMPLVPGAKYTYSASGLDASEWNGSVASPDAISKEIAFVRKDTVVVANVTFKKLDLRSWFFLRASDGVRYGGKFATYKDGFTQDFDFTQPSLWLKTGVVPGSVVDNGFGGTSLQGAASWQSTVAYSYKPSSGAALTKSSALDSYSDVVIENVTTPAYSGPALRVKRLEDVGSTAQNQETWWYANGIGAVKYRDELSPGLPETSLLKRYSLPVNEFYLAERDNYFVTADNGEANFVESGGAGAFTNRKKPFRGVLLADPAYNYVKLCRFYGNTNVNPATGAIYGPRSHFYTADASECQFLKNSYVANAASWKFESNEFQVALPANGACPAGTTGVARFYNNGFPKKDSNHRYVPLPNVATERAAMEARGWILEANGGPVFCSIDD